VCFFSFSIDYFVLVTLFTFALLCLFSPVLRSTCEHYIFVPRFLLLSSFFPRLVTDWMSTIRPHMMWPKTVVTCAICCMQQIACNRFRIWAGLSLSISVWLVTSCPKCRLTKSYCYYHVTPPNAVIGCNTLASWIFSNTFESLQLLHATIVARCMQ